jgi:hypothetical protein
MMSDCSRKVQDAMGRSLMATWKGFGGCSPEVGSCAKALERIWEVGATEPNEQGLRLAAN